MNKAQNYARLDFDYSAVWIDHVSVARPQVPDRDKLAQEKRVYPSEVRICVSRLDVFYTVCLRPVNALHHTEGE